MIRRKARLSALVSLSASVLVLSACGASADYPSLSRRPAERISGSAPAVQPSAPPPVAAAPSPEFAGRLAQLVEQAAAAHGQFKARQGNAERLVAAAGNAAVASEGWSVASVALADLESSRSEAMVALAELDGIYAAEAVASAQAQDTGRRDAAAAARERVVSLVGEEDEVLARLRGRLRS